jgi:hypothetical protein
MALTQILTLDIIDNLASITFNNPAQIDQVSFASNQITFSICSIFNLVKSDLILYIKYLTQFNASLIINFPSVGTSINQSFPISNFQVNRTSLGVTHINYIEGTGSSTVYSINYVPIAGAASFVARISPVTISLQEFYMCIYMMQQYLQQILVN